MVAGTGPPEGPITVAVSTAPVETEGAMVVAGAAAVALPGRPASHACVRLLERDARWIHDWGDGWRLDEDGRSLQAPGTPLWIVGDYDFDSPHPG